MMQASAKSWMTDTMSARMTMSYCAFAATSILIIRTLSLSLSVLLSLGLVLCGILISLGLRRIKPRTEQS